MSIITLTSDFGNKDHFVGALKGKILTEDPGATIVDISHEVDPFNVSDAAYIVSMAYKSFPPGTVHIIAVETEWAANRQHLAFKWNDHYFICADNGIPGLMTSRLMAEKIVTINLRDNLDLPTDLDVFVKVAVHLSKGGLLNVVGKETSQMNRPTELRAQVSSDKKTIKGYIIYIDHLGNVVTNITKKMFLEAAGSREFEIILNEKTHPANRTKNITAIYDRYIDGVGRSAIVDGQKIAVFNEAGYLEIGLYRSNAKTTGTASTLLGLNYLDPVTIQFN